MIVSEASNPKSDTDWRNMESYLTLFEEAIRIQAEMIGEERALEQARKAGLGVSKSGRIVSCAGNPPLVLLRLIRHFTEDGNLRALHACSPLIVKLTELSTEMESAVTGRSSRS
jgi:hypothetical protein